MHEHTEGRVLHRESLPIPHCSRARHAQNGCCSSGRGQALLETMFVLPVVLVLIMILSEFGIYFYRANLLETTAQTMGRMAARGSTKAQVESYMTSRISTLNPTLAVVDNAGTAITSWSSDQAIRLTVTATVTPVMPISALNIFGGGAQIFPASFTLRAVKTVYVE